MFQLIHYTARGGQGMAFKCPQITHMVLFNRSCRAEMHGNLKES